MIAGILLLGLIARYSGFELIALADVDRRELHREVPISSSMIETFLPLGVPQV